MGAAARTFACVGALGFLPAACGARTDVGPEPPIETPDASGVPTCELDADDLSAAATSPYGACGEGINTSLEPTAACHFGGGGTLAFEYVPATDFILRRIEIFTNRGVVGLLDSDHCGGPGATLFKGALDSAGDQADWRGAYLDHAIALRAKHKYFVWQGPGNDWRLICSVANDPTSKGNVREYTSDGMSDPTSPWRGPYEGTAWTARLIGLCP